ncbi:imidazolonepropionase [Nitrincola alkalisediminis]|uniref:imidazolonepropionase n=1 Tax=Nitrincola alkalisediminis TaxID=1366656 RepID=UPI0018749095|nr:imidazolonepropionase [Nitrincola alkalisediminis]
MVDLSACDRVWINATLATQSIDSTEPYGVLNDALIGVREGRITHIESMSNLDVEALQGLDVQDVQGRWITPGLIDAHTHLVYSGSRAKEFEMRLQGATYEEIAKAGGGILSSVQHTRVASFEQLLAESVPRLQALMAEGVTCVEIKSGYGLDLETELKLLRVARHLAQLFPVRISTTLLAAHALPPEYKDRSDAYIDFICDELLPLAVAEGLVDAVDVFCESIGFSAAQSERLFQAANRYGLGIHIHAEQLSQQHGAALAARYGAWSADHLEWLDEEGVEAMKAAKTQATLLPGAFYFLRETRLPPIDLLRTHQVPMVVATDLNPGTSPFASLRLAMNMACTLFRLTPEEALAGVTRHAASALGMGESLGQLRPGFLADFVVWDVQHPADLAYQCGVRAVYQRVFNGEISHA